MENIKQKMKKNITFLFLKSDTQETEKVCSWKYFLINNQVQQTNKKNNRNCTDKAMLALHNWQISLDL